MALTRFYRGLTGILRRDPRASRVKDEWKKVIGGDKEKPDTWLARIRDSEANKPYCIVVEYYTTQLEDKPLTQDELHEDTLVTRVLESKLDPHTQGAKYDTRLMLKIGEMPEGARFKSEALEPDVIVFFLNGEIVYGYTRVRSESHRDIPHSERLKYFGTMDGLVNFVQSNFMIPWNSFRSIFNDPQLPKQKLEILVKYNFPEGLVEMSDGLEQRSKNIWVYEDGVYSLDLSNAHPNYPSHNLIVSRFVDKTRIGFFGVEKHREGRPPSLILRAYFYCGEFACGVYRPETQFIADSVTLKKLLAEYFKLTQYDDFRNLFVDSNLPKPQRESIEALIR